jgi:hypothetical protein
LCHTKDPLDNTHTPSRNRAAIGLVVRVTRPSQFSDSSGNALSSRSLFQSQTRIPGRTRGMHASTCTSTVLSLLEQPCPHRHHSLICLPGGAKSHPARAGKHHCVNWYPATARFRRKQLVCLLRKSIPLFVLLSLCDLHDLPVHTAVRLNVLVTLQRSEP